MPAHFTQDDLKAATAAVAADDKAFREAYDLSRKTDEAIRAKDPLLPPPAPPGTTCGYSQDGKTGFVVEPGGRLGDLCAMPLPADVCAAYSTVALNPHDACESVLQTCSGLSRNVDPNLDPQYAATCSSTVDDIRNRINEGAQVSPGTDPELDNSMAQLQHILQVAMTQGSDVPDRVHSFSVGGQQLADWAADDIGAQGGGGLGDPVTEPWEIPIKLADPVFWFTGSVVSLIPVSYEDIQRPR